MGQISLPTFWAIARLWDGRHLVKKIKSYRLFSFIFFKHFPFYLILGILKFGVYRKAIYPDKLEDTLMKIMR